MVSIKSICALTSLHITLLSNDSSNAAVVMAAGTTTTTPSSSSPKFGKLHVMHMKSASLFSQSASYQVDVDPAFMSEGRGRDVFGRPISMAAFLAAEKTNRPPSPPDAADAVVTMMKKEDVPVREDRYYGSAWLGSSFLRQMQQHAGVDLSSSSSDDVVDTSDDTVLHKMKMTHIVKSSPWHTDVMVEERSTTPKQVGFYLLNDNPRAYFETKDVDLCIPILKGSFVTFNGRRPHHTVIMDGHVDMLGPFDVFSAKGVDGTEDTIVGSVVPLDEEGHDSESIAVLNQEGRDSEDGARPVLQEEEKLSLVADTPAYPTEGRAYFGRTYQAASVRNHGYVFAYDAVLTPCESCKVTLALTSSDEAFKCTKEAYDKAIMLRLSDQLTYTADESGSTGMKRLTFDSPNPIVATNLALFFCNAEGEPVACSFMKPATLMEEVEVNKALFPEYGEQSNEGEVGSLDDSNAGSSSVWSILATGLVASGIIIYAL